MARLPETWINGASGDTSPTRRERLIAAGRAVLAAFSLLAIWLDPSDPAKYAQHAFTALSM